MIRCRGVPSWAHRRSAGAYAALQQWRAGDGRRPAGVNWEVYGDWDDDPAKRRTGVCFLLEPVTR